MSVCCKSHYPMRLCISLLLVTGMLFAQRNTAPEAVGSRNKAERLEWFRDLGFGMFIHWSHDSQLGSVISHSMVGASKDYLQRYVNDLPLTFNPRKFAPRDWAVLAKLAGMKYVVFTTKHHNGFTMWPSKTTSFGVQSTPFRRDIVREVLDAFREQGIAAGVYYSPDDFWYLLQKGIPLQRNIDGVYPTNVPGLMDYDKAQIRELYTEYGKIDIMFFDGPPEGLRELAWDLQPETVVTRGAIATPEQYVPGARIEGPWESNLTMGTQWQYKPTNDQYKPGGELIRLLIETRAKGGNLLLNVGPKPDGELPIEQEERLREVALWMFINGEAIHATRPWIVPSENAAGDEFWFTKAKNADTVYVMVRPRERWAYGAWKEFTLRSVAATPQTQISVLGQNDEVLEYQPGVVPKSTFRQEGGALKIRAMHAQRIYNDRKWPNPIVVKLTNVKPAFAPPVVDELSWQWDTQRKGAVLRARVANVGEGVEVGFEYRSVKGLDLTERPSGFTRTALARRTSDGAFALAVPEWKPGDVMEYRAVVKHPLLEVFSLEQRAEVR